MYTTIEKKRVKRVITRNDFYEASFCRFGVAFTAYLTVCIQNTFHKIFIMALSHKLTGRKIILHNLWLC